MALAQQYDDGQATAGLPHKQAAGILNGAVRSFGFWQQGLTPGDWSCEIIARNLDGEDFKGYRRASDPSHLRACSPLLPEAQDVLPDEIVVQTGSLVPGMTEDQTVSAIGRLVAAYGGESARDEIDAEALVQPARADLSRDDLYGIELVDTVAAAARRAGLEGSPMHAAMRGIKPARPVREDSLAETASRRPFRRATDPRLVRPDRAGSAPFQGRSPIQSADDFLGL